MFLGVWKADHPWRWMLLVWMGLPLVLAYYQFVVKWPHDRGQVYMCFLQLLAASAGAFGGHFMHRMIANVFKKAGLAAGLPAGPNSQSARFTRAGHQQHHPGGAQHATHGGRQLFPAECVVMPMEASPTLARGLWLMGKGHEEGENSNDEDYQTNPG